MKEKVILAELGLFQEMDEDDGYISGIKINNNFWTLNKTVRDKIIKGWKICLDELDEKSEEQVTQKNVVNLRDWNIQ